MSGCRDTAGQERFRSMTRCQYRGTKVRLQRTLHRVNTTLSAAVGKFVGKRPCQAILLHARCRDAMQDRHHHHHDTIIIIIIIVIILLRRYFLNKNSAASAIVSAHFTECHWVLIASADSSTFATTQYQHSLVRRRYRVETSTIPHLVNCRAMLCISAAYMPSCGVCVSVCVSVTFVNSVKTNKRSIKFFSPRVATPF